MSARQQRGVPVWVALGIGFVVAAIIIVAGIVLHVALQAPATDSGPTVGTTSSSAAATSSPTPTEAAPANTPTSAAAAFVAAFTDHTTPADVWEKTYANFLTDQARAAYQGTRRAQVPGTKVTGPARLAAGASSTPVPGAADDDGDTDPVPAIVTVPTDAGTYTVNLQQQDGRWLVVSAEVPGSGQ